MKTTLDIDDRLLTSAKSLAAEKRTTLTRLIEEGLTLRLQAEATPRRPLRMRVFKGRGGLIAGIDPVSNRSVLDALDDDA